MVNYKFFSTKYMLKGHIKALRRSRRRLVTEKVINYDDGAVLEHYNYESPIYIMPKDDWVLKELSELKIGDDNSYDYKSLSSDFKKYMRLKDDEFFNKEYNEWKNAKAIELARQNRAIENAEMHFDRDLFQDELHELLLGNVVYETPTYLKAKRSNRRAYKTVIELIRSNINEFENFITLTFAEEEHRDKHLEFGTVFKYCDSPYDFETVKKEFSNFIKTLSTNLRRNGYDFSYIAVYEQHKTGKYHFHLLTSRIPEGYLVDCPEWLDMDYRTGERRNGKMLRHWEFGKSDVEEIKDKDRMATYLCKYLIKNFHALNNDDESYEEFLGKKKYFCSKGLKRPTVEYFNGQDQKLLEVLEKRKAEYSDIYSTTYINPYSEKEIVKTTCSK